MAGAYPSSDLVSPTAGCPTDYIETGVHYLYEVGGERLRPDGEQQLPLDPRR